MSVARTHQSRVCAAVLATCALVLNTTRALALDPDSARTEEAAVVRLSAQQTQAFRAWMVRIVDTQIAAGPTPRWKQRDCAGLVRFAVAEAMQTHDADWLHANGITAGIPPELELTGAQKALRHNWRLTTGMRSAFVGALELVQENARFVSKDINEALAGDLLLFDQGDDQHLMIWTGRYIAYHTGTSERDDNGLRAVSPGQLSKWRDTRWQPLSHNPNFLGVYRLRFLAR